MVMNRMRLEAVKTQKDHQAETNRLLEENVEIDHLLMKKMVDVGGLQEIGRDTKQALAKGKEELSLKTKKRAKVEVEATEMKDQVSRQLRKERAQAVEEFKASSKMKNIKVEFV